MVLLILKEPADNDYRYQANFFLGTIISTWIEFGLSYLPGNPDFQWRLPMGLQALPSVLVLTFIWFIPETPRQYGLQAVCLPLYS